MEQCKEVEAYEQMTREQQKRYIKMLVTSVKRHKENAKVDSELGYYKSAKVHYDNAHDGLVSLGNLLSPVIFRDVCEEL